MSIPFIFKPASPGFMTRSGSRLTSFISSILRLPSLDKGFFELAFLLGQAIPISAHIFLSPKS